jgi:RNA polymerase sigma-70 factor (ECF subfamily)
MNDRTVHLTPQAAESAALANEAGLEFEAFFDREKARLFQALCVVTRNRFEAEELTQEAFMAVYERWDRVGAMDDPTGYLFRTAMNTFRSWRRRSALAAKRAMRLMPSDDSIVHIEEQDMMARALASLTERQRAAVVLIDLMGYSSEEVGRMLGVDASTVRSHIKRAHAELKTRMDASHD